MIADGQTTYHRILHLLGDGKWHTENELDAVAYFPREWIKELNVSGRHVTTTENGCLKVKLDR